MATERQVAYLKHLGQRRVSQLSTEQASRRIEQLHRKAEGWCGRKLRSRIDEWWYERLVQHPDLYRKELLDYLVADDGRFRSYLRGRHVECTEQLTAAKMKKVFSHLLDTTPGWWQHADASKRFYEEVSSMFPGCVDGPKPSVGGKLAARLEGKRRGKYLKVAALLGVGLLLIWLLVS